VLSSQSPPARRWPPARRRCSPAACSAGGRRWLSTVLTETPQRRRDLPYWCAPAARKPHQLRASARREQVHAGPAPRSRNAFPFGAAAARPGAGAVCTVSIRIEWSTGFLQEIDQPRASSCARRPAQSPCPVMMITGMLTPALAGGVRSSSSAGRARHAEVEQQASRGAPGPKSARKASAPAKYARGQVCGR